MKFILPPLKILLKLAAFIYIIWLILALLYSPFKVYELRKECIKRNGWMVGFIWCEVPTSYSELVYDSGIEIASYLGKQLFGIKDKTVNKHTRCYEINDRALSLRGERGKLKVYLEDVLNDSIKSDIGVRLKMLSDSYYSDKKPLTDDFLAFVSHIFLYSIIECKLRPKQKFHDVLIEIAEFTAKTKVNITPDHYDSQLVPD